METTLAVAMSTIWAMLTNSRATSAMLGRTRSIWGRPRPASGTFGTCGTSTYLRQSWPILPTFGAELGLTPVKQQPPAEGPERRSGSAQQSMTPRNQAGDISENLARRSPTLIESGQTLVEPVQASAETRHTLTEPDSDLAEAGPSLVEPRLDTFVGIRRELPQMWLTCWPSSAKLG